MSVITGMPMIYRAYAYIVLKIFLPVNDRESQGFVPVMFFFQHCEMCYREITGNFPCRYRVPIATWGFAYDLPVF